MHRYQRGAAHAAELPKHLLACGKCPGIQPVGRRRLPLPVREALRESVHRALAGVLSARHASHAVGHHRQQALPLLSLRVRGVAHGKGVLLMLPASDALDISHPQHWRGRLLVWGGLSGLLPASWAGAFPCFGLSLSGGCCVLPGRRILLGVCGPAPAKQPVKESHQSSSFFQVNCSPHRGTKTSFVSPKSIRS